MLNNIVSKLQRYSETQLWGVVGGFAVMILLLFIMISPVSALFVPLQNPYSYSIKFINNQPAMVFFANSYMSPYGYFEFRQSPSNGDVLLAKAQDVNDYSNRILRNPKGFVESEGMQKGLTPTYWVDLKNYLSKPLDCNEEKMASLQSFFPTERPKFIIEFESQIDIKTLKIFDKQLPILVVNNYTGSKNRYVCSEQQVEKILNDFESKITLLFTP